MVYPTVETEGTTADQLGTRIGQPWAIDNQRLVDEGFEPDVDILRCTQVEAVDGAPRRFLWTSAYHPELAARLLVRPLRDLPEADPDYEPPETGASGLSPPPPRR